MIGRAALAALIVAPSLLACAQKRKPEPIEEPIDLRVELFGCASVRADRTCELPAGGALQAWIAASPGASVTFAIEGQALTTAVAAAKAVAPTAHVEGGSPACHT